MAIPFVFAFALSFLGVGALLASTPAHAWETDQFSERSVPLRDALGTMNAKINLELELFADEWNRSQRGAPVEADLVARFAKAVNGSSWLGTLVGEYERWVTTSDEIERHSLPWPSGSIYGDAPASASHANWLMGSCPTILLGGVRMGTDKPGHFFSQGYELYEAYQRAGRDEGAAFARGRKMEETYFGLWVSGVYSNADLVANAEGFRFLRSLLGEGGTPGFFQFEDGKLRVARAFDWRDYVNEYWDEAFNPSWLASDLQAAVLPRLRALCADYVRAPASYVVPPARDAELGARYGALGFRPAPSNRLDHVCRDSAMTD